MRILIPLLVLASSNAFAQPVTAEQRAKVLKEMQTCMKAAANHEAVGDTQFRRGKFAEAVREYEASMTCDGTVPNAHEKAKVALAACRAGDAAKAKQYYPEVSYAHRRGLEAVCGKQNITLRAAASAAVPANLDKDMIGEAIEPALNAIKVCVMSSVANRMSGFRVMISGTTAADGSVAKVDARGPWSTCLEAIVSGVRFPVTRAGSAFSSTVFVDPSVLKPDLAAGHAERWFAQGRHADAIRQWVWILGGGPSPKHFERAMEMACGAKLDADATLFYWMLDRTQQATTAPMCAKLGVTF